MHRVLTGRRLDAAQPDHILPGIRQELVIAQLLVAALAAALLATKWNALPTPPTLQFVGAFYLIHSAWLLASARLAQGRWVSGYVAFSVMLLMFSGGRLYLAGLGAVEEQILDGRVGDLPLLRAALLVNASVATFHLGGLGGLAGQMPRRRLKRVIDLRCLRPLGVTLLCLGAIGFVFSAYDMVQRVAESGYMALFSKYRTGAANWDGILATALAPGLMIVFAADSRRPRSVRAIWMIGIAHMVTLLFVGDRSGALCVLFPMVLLQHGLVSPFKRRTAVIAGLAMALLIPTVAAIRILDSASRSHGWRDGDLGLVSSLKAVTMESGFSMTTVAGTIERVPSLRSFDLGAGYARAALAPIPNLFWDEHPASSAKSYAYWLIWQMDPSWAGLGGGYGYSVIAEAYANFGIWGALSILACLGFLLGRLSLRSLVTPHSVLLFEALVLWAIMMLPRSETAAVTRPLVWFVFVPFMMAVVSRRKVGDRINRSIR